MPAGAATTAWAMAGCATLSELERGTARARPSVRVANDDAEDRARNRRVEIFLREPDQSGH